MSKHCVILEWSNVPASSSLMLACNIALLLVSGFGYSALHLAAMSLMYVMVLGLVFGCTFVTCEGHTTFDIIAHYPRLEDLNQIINKFANWCRRILLWQNKVCSLKVFGLLYIISRVFAAFNTTFILFVVMNSILLWKFMEPPISQGLTFVEDFVSEVYHNIPRLETLKARQNTDKKTT